MSASAASGRSAGRSARSSARRRRTTAPDTGRSWRRTASSWLPPGPGDGRRATPTSSSFGEAGSDGSCLGSFQTDRPTPQGDDMPTTKASSQTTADGRGFSTAEKAAMRERAKELKSAEKARDARAEGLRDLLAKVAEMPPADRAIAERLHELVTTNAPELDPKTYYGMPAYARNGRGVCFFKPASKFNVRYATFGFEDEARIDDGQLFPASFGVKDMTKADEARLVELIKKA